MSGNEATEMVPEKLTLRLSPEARKTLEWIATTSGVTLAEAIRRALGTEKYMLEQVKKGNTIVIEEPNGRAKELIFR
jgi:hypothetical protein